MRAAQSVDRRLVADVSVFDLYEGKGIEAGQEVDRHRRHLAAARQDHDRRRDRRARPADRRGSDKAHRRRAAGLGANHLDRSSAVRKKRKDRGYWVPACVGTTAESSSRHQIRKGEAVALDRRADADRDLARQHRSGRNESVEFAVLPARIDPRR